jgi:hypothetical protein
MDEIQTIRIGFIPSDEIAYSKRVTYDDLWVARKKMEGLWWRQCRVCDFPGWTQEQEDAITKQAIESQRKYYRLYDL